MTVIMMKAYSNSSVTMLIGFIDNALAGGNLDNNINHNHPLPIISIPHIRVPMIQIPIHLPFQ
jgi:hypothetical protein